MYWMEPLSAVRMEKAYPVYDQTYQENVKTIRGYLETLSNLQTIGRNGLHRYNNQDHSMLTAVYAAHNIIGGRHDVWAVNTDMEYHEEGRVAQLNPGDRLVPAPVSVSVADEIQGQEDEVIEAMFARLDPLALGVAVGTVSAFGTLVATAILLFKGGTVIGPNLSLLKHYLFGFEMTWAGAFVGFLEAGLWGLAFGFCTAGLRNWTLNVYASLVRQRGEADARRDLLDKV